MTAKPSPGLMSLVALGARVDQIDLTIVSSSRVQPFLIHEGSRSQRSEVHTSHMPNHAPGFCIFIILYYFLYFKVNGKEFIRFNDAGYTSWYQHARRPICLHPLALGIRAFLLGVQCWYLLKV